MQRFPAVASTKPPLKEQPSGAVVPSNMCVFTLTPVASGIGKLIDEKRFELWPTSGNAPIAHIPVSLLPEGSVPPAVHGEPSFPFVPFLPAAPAAPAAPVSPVAPAAPCGPTAPAGPCGPAEPTAPAAPAGPVAPAFPFSEASTLGLICFVEVIKNLLAAYAPPL